MIAAADEPVDSIRLELDDDVLEDARPLVVGFLLVQVVMAAGAGDLDHQLGCADDVTRFDPGLAAQLLGNPQLAIGLGLAADDPGSPSSSCRREGPW